MRLQEKLIFTFFFFFLPPEEKGNGSIRTVVLRTSRGTPHSTARGHEERAGWLTGYARVVSHHTAPSIRTSPRAEPSAGSGSRH